LNILDLVRRLGLEPRKQATTKGGEYACACPGCGGEDRSGRHSDRFRIWPDQNEGQGGYWCRRCLKGGDAIQFLRDFEGLSFRQACERIGRPAPDSKDLRMRPRKSPGADWSPREPGDPEARWREHARKLAKYAWEQLLGNDEELRRLEARGIGVDAVRSFSLGWLGKDVFRARESWGLSKVMSEKTGKARPLWFPKGVVIPWFQAFDIVKLRIRRPKPVKFGPAYYMVSGSASVTTLIRPKRAGCVPREIYVVVESELDAYMIASQTGGVCGAVALGSNSAHPDAEAAKILRSAAVILNALDYDEAGASQTQWWVEHVPQSKRWPVPVGKDPGEAYQQGVDIREWVIAGLPAGMRR
jgi:hypothetical protein